MPELFFSPKKREDRKIKDEISGNLQCNWPVLFWILLKWFDKCVFSFKHFCFIIGPWWFKSFFFLFFYLGTKQQLWKKCSVSTVSYWLLVQLVWESDLSSRPSVWTVESGGERNWFLPHRSDQVPPTPTLTKSWTHTDDHLRSCGPMNLCTNRWAHFMNGRARMCMCSHSALWGSVV